MYNTVTSAYSSNVGILPLHRRNVTHQGYRWQLYAWMDKSVAIFMEWYNIMDICYALRLHDIVIFCTSLVTWYSSQQSYVKCLYSSLQVFKIFKELLIRTYPVISTKLLQGVWNFPEISEQFFCNFCKIVFKILENCIPISWKNTYEWKIF